MQKVAALFVQTGGTYYGLDSVDPWDIKRDARQYKGPYPVVAHPPCNLWGRFAAINYKRWGGEHNRPGNDGGCFASAFDAVRTYGGVLEHPADTKAFAAYAIARPSKSGWTKHTGCRSNGMWYTYWVCEVWQSAYGHKARKRTWLFYHGKRAPFELNWTRNPGTHQIGQHDQRGKACNKPTLSGKAASATPIEFRDILIALARHSME